MVEDNLAQALAELEDALNPERLAMNMLDDTGKASNRYNEQVGPWEDQTGRLRDAFTFETESGTRVSVLTEINEMEYAPYVEDHEGLSVLTSFYDGTVMRLLEESFNTHKATGTL
jgi:hypothetical protein